MKKTGSAPAPNRVDVIIVGAGHSGLAMSYFLSRAGLDHLILEKGEAGEAWRHRWDSLRLLTPNWQCGLPGKRYDGPDPDGYMAAAEVGNYLSRYAVSIDAPVRGGITVTAVSAESGGFRVETDHGTWRCRALVVASGAFRTPAVPRLSREIPVDIHQVTAADYRHPGLLPNGKVLVVGGSATGMQLAEEIQLSGRQVLLATGEHVRLPRHYRGRDIQSWMDALGVLDERHDAIEDLHRARQLPSAQLIGALRDIDINAVQSLGVRIAGRLMAASDGKLQFSGSLENLCALADLKMKRLLKRIEEWIGDNELDDHFPAPAEFVPTRLAGSPPLEITLAAEGISSVVWATGFRPDYSWLNIPVFDRAGRLQHDGGTVGIPGLYVMGLPFMRRRKSSFIHGAEDDARDLSSHLARHLARLGIGRAVA